MSLLCPVGETHALNYTSHHACWTTGRRWIRSERPIENLSPDFATAQRRYWMGFDPVNTPSSQLPVFLHTLTVKDTHRHTPSHTLYLKLIWVFSYSIFIFMCATPGGCSFTWACWNISALPQHEAKQYEWLPVCLALVPLTSLRCQQVSVTLGSSYTHANTQHTHTEQHTLYWKPFIHTQTCTHNLL